MSVVYIAQACRCLALFSEGKSSIQPLELYLDTRDLEAKVVIYPPVITTLSVSVILHALLYIKGVPKKGGIRKLGPK